MNPVSTPVVIREVGLRDGLQSIARVVPTARKLEWIRAAHAAGQREIEVGSFVPPRLLPQLADTETLVAFARTLPGLCVSVLVPNLKGAERALASGADAMLLPLSASHAHSLANLRKTPDEVVREIARIRAARDASGANVMLLPLSASHAHSLANLRKTPDEVVQEIARIRAARDAAGSKCLLEVGISTAFGCTIQGRVEPAEVLRLVAAALDAGADRVGLADTVGYADPLMVRRLFEQCGAVAGERLSCGHFHDTRGLGMANVYAAWEAGIRRFDACLGGIGGCPHAPGASGNVATEDVAYLFASMGVPTGLDFDALIALRATVATWLDGETLHGTLWRAGLPRTLRPAAGVTT